MPGFHRLLRAQSDQHPQDDDSDLPEEFAPAMDRVVFVMSFHAFGSRIWVQRG